jgi:hypothetical protein
MNNCSTCPWPGGSGRAIILILKQNLPRNTRFEALEPHFRVPNCPRKGPGIPSVRSCHRLGSPHALSPLTQASPSWPSQTPGFQPRLNKTARFNRASSNALRPLLIPRIYSLLKPLFYPSAVCLGKVIHRSVNGRGTLFKNLATILGILSY